MSAGACLHVGEHCNQRPVLGLRFSERATGRSRWPFLTAWRSLFGAVLYAYIRCGNDTPPFARGTSVSLGQFYLPRAIPVRTSYVVLARQKFSFLFFDMALSVCGEHLGLVGSIQTGELQLKMAVSSVLDFSHYWSGSGSERPHDHGPAGEAASVRERAL